MNWTDTLDDRQRKEIAFARLYVTRFSHGTDGHHRLGLIAKLADLLDQLSGELQLARLRAPEDRSGIEEEGADSLASLNE